jgi:15-cis-phytoene synthase
MIADSSCMIPIEPAAARRLTDEVIRSRSRTFYFATHFLPRRQREGIRALYAFCRATDDLADDGPADWAVMEAWRCQVRRPAEEQTDPLLFTWARVRQEYAVDRRYEEELIDGMEMDLNFRPYTTWAELENYCYHVASTVGLLSTPIIGLAPGVTFEQAAPYAIRLGIALQLTNILRDVGEDAGRGRIYLPEEDLLRFGLRKEDIATGVQDERFEALMKFEIERNRALYRQALPGIRLLSSQARLAVGAAALLYRAILGEIEAARYRVFCHRAHTSAMKKLALLPGILWTVNTIRDPL